MRLHLEKPGIRVLGVAESFSPVQRFSTLAGVVMRSDRVIDGFAIGKASVGGDDASRSIAKLFRSLRRNDVNAIMISGAILSLYNIVDVDGLSRKVRLPVVCLTYKETAGIEDAIRRHFTSPEAKLASYRALGERLRVKLRSGRIVFARGSGISAAETKALVDLFTLQGSIPEPVRVARMLARSVAPRRSSRLG